MYSQLSALLAQQQHSDVVILATLDTGHDGLVPFSWMFPQWTTWTCFLKCERASCPRLRPVKALKDGMQSLPCKSRGNTRCRALQVLIRGNGSKDTLIRLELPFLPTWNSSAVCFMSGPAAAPALFVSWKIGISLDKSLAKASFPSSFYGQTCIFKIKGCFHVNKRVIVLLTKFCRVHTHHLHRRQIWLVHWTCSIICLKVVS